MAEGRPLFRNPFVILGILVCGVLAWPHLQEAYQRHHASASTPEPSNASRRGSSIPSAAPQNPSAPPKTIFDRLFEDPISSTTRESPFSANGWNRAIGSKAKTSPDDSSLPPPRGVNPDGLYISEKFYFLRQGRTEPCIQVLQFLAGRRVNIYRIALKSDIDTKSLRFLSAAQIKNHLDLLESAEKHAFTYREVFLDAEDPFPKSFPIDISGSALSPAQVAGLALPSKVSLIFNGRLFQPGLRPRRHSDGRLLDPHDYSFYSSASLK